ncbi:MAG: metalloregulator ArsR/SmtB family transcription factor [Nanoarchaeota archaeon]|nr:metalloregulator ArsR/SmtB family transcription factor [Nanoarchaeota archaeon]
MADDIMKDMSINIKRWTVIFRVLANVNRLKIISMLSDGKTMNVSEITNDLKISFKATSNHLAILKNLDVLEPRGADGHVFYKINQEMPKDFRKAIDVWI